MLQLPANPHLLSTHRLVTGAFRDSDLGSHILCFRGAFACLGAGSCLDLDAAQRGFYARPIFERGARALNRPANRSRSGEDRIASLTCIGRAGLAAFGLSPRHEPFLSVLGHSKRRHGRQPVRYPYFAYLTRIFGPERRRAITLVTLAAGLAGTVSFLGFYWLTELLDWRAAVRIAAAVAVGIVARLNIVATQFGDRLPLPADSEQNVEHPRAPQFWRTPLFWLLSFGIAAMSINHAVLMTHIRPLLSDRSLQDGVVVGLAATVGPMQVAGRLVLLSFERRMSTFSLVLVSLLIAIGAAGLLLFTSG